MKYSLILLLTFLVSCGSSSTLSEKARELKILTQKPKDETKCMPVKKVRGEDEDGSDAMARNRAKNLAAEAGANAIFIEDIVANGKKRVVVAMSYECD